MQDDVVMNEMTSKMSNIDIGDELDELLNHLPDTVTQRVNEQVGLFIRELKRGTSRKKWPTMTRELLKEV
jgi:hypothetical protein